MPLFPHSRICSGGASTLDLLGEDEDGKAPSLRDQRSGGVTLVGGEGR